MWQANPKETQYNQQFYRKCGAYTICKYPPKYILTSRAGDDLIIHCVGDSFKECAEFYEKQIRNKTTPADADLSHDSAAD